jgi:membrane protein
MAHALQSIRFVMFRTFRITLTWIELIRRTIRETITDKVPGISAELAYYFLLALAPATVFVAALASFFPGSLIQDVIGRLGGVVPSAALEIIRGQLLNIASGQNGGVLTFGLLLALWSSSAAIVGVTEALNRAYDIEEARPWWKVRLTASLLTIALAVFVVVAFALVLIGPTLIDQLAARFGSSQLTATIWKVLQWPLVFAIVATGIGLIFYFAPDAEQEWEWITPGAVLATVLWLIASLVFKIYVANFADYNATYGSLGGVIVLMLWFYISAFAILVGAEMNAEIEHASPHGKAPGEKVPGQRKKIGPLAAREFAAQNEFRKTA